MKFFFAILFFFVFLTGSTQNLVPNSSFEIIDTCPDNGGQIQYAPPWNNPTYLASTSPDLFDTCGTLGYDVPSTLFGNIIPHTGGACAGIGTYDPLFGQREYIQVELSDTMKAGKKYFVKFYVWLADSAQWATYNFGAYFSKTIVDTFTYYNLPYIPQIANSPSNPLTTKEIWVEISYSFFATGGEKYMIIGNFDDNINTSAIFVGGSTNPIYNGSFYFIDDISVTLSDSVGIDEQFLEKSINIYPNPTNGEFYINVSNINVSEISIYNLFGKSIYFININSVQQNNLFTINLNNGEEGIYFLKLKTSKGIIAKKIMITK